MRTLLDDAPVVEDNNLVGIADGREPVGYDEGGAAFHNGVHTLLHKLLRAGVNR